MNQKLCVEHNEPIQQVCMGQDCQRRLMCYLCRDIPLHRYHMRVIPFNLEQMIKNKTYRYMERCNNRLNHMINHLNKKFMMEVESVKAAVCRRIKVNCWTDLIKDDGVLLDQLHQIRRGEYGNLDLKAFESVRHILIEEEREDEGLSQDDLSRLDKLVSNAFQEIRLAEKFFWEAVSPKHKKPPSVKPILKIFKVLKQPLQSPQRIRREVEQNDRGVEHLQSMLVTEAKKEGGRLDLSNRKPIQSSLIPELFQAPRLQWTRITQLNISKNHLKNIEFMLELDAPNLKKLTASNNQIHSVWVLDTANLQKLSEIYLDNNKITNLYAFQKMQWPELRILDISTNQVSTVDGVQHFNFPRLQRINLDFNHICSLKPFQHVVWPHIERISVKGVKLGIKEELDQLKSRNEAIFQKFWMGL